MVTLELLRQTITDRGVLFKYLAEAAEMTPQSFSAKLSGKRDFTLMEIQAIARALHLTPEESAAIFFTDNVAETDT